MSTAAVTVADVEVGYDRTPDARRRARRRSPSRRRRVILAGVNAALHPGELVCLIGPNGTGKSTLLRTLAGFQRPLAGEVRIAGRPLAALSPRDVARHLAVVLTERAVVGQLRGYDLVALGRYPHTDWSGRLDSADHRIIRRALAATGAADVARHAVSELSDGERQRLMIARALAQEPRVLLLDEPTAFLDVTGRLELTKLLLGLAHDHRLAVLMSTHDVEHMLRHADRLWLIHDGRLTVGAPEDLGLAGDLQRALVNTRGVRFDPSTGMFQTNRSARGAVRLRGDGDARLWTERAVRRAGYAISDDAAIEITWHSEPGSAKELPHARNRWRLHNGETSHDVRSLRALVAQLHDLTRHEHL